MTQCEPRIRVFREGDERKVNDSFNRELGVNRSLDEWSWKYPARPDGRLIVLAEDDEKILAHCAGQPLRFFVDGCEWSAVRIVDIFPAAGDMTVRTVEAFIDEFGRFGRFPIFLDVSRIRDRDSIAEQAHSSPHRTQPLGKLVRRGVSRRPLRSFLYRAEPSRDWEPRLDGLWQRANFSYPVAVVRDAEYALHRFAGHPNVCYHRFVVLPRFSKQVVAFAVFRTDDRRCRWLDLLWDHDHPGALDLLSHLSTRLAVQSGAETEEIGLHGDPTGRARLETLGFERVDQDDDPALTVRAFDPTLSPSTFDGQVYLTLADSDLA